jgi:hypothetical protein
MLAAGAALVQSAASAAGSGAGDDQGRVMANPDQSCDDVNQALISLLAERLARPF